MTDNAGSGSQQVSLTGQGIAPAVSVAPGSLVFGDQLVGTTSEEQDVTLTNTGSAPLTVYGRQPGWNECG